MKGNKFVASFFKVSFEQFSEDCAKFGLVNMGDETSVEQLKKKWDTILTPSRTTTGSAGYDFTCPFDIEVGEKAVTIPTGVRCSIARDHFLAIVPRSSFGFKYGMQLSNTIGIIDSDYFDADNEGHIMIRVKSDEPFTIHAGDRFVQGILLPYDYSVNGNNTAVRTGGIGSTGK